MKYPTGHQATCGLYGNKRPPPFITPLRLTQCDIFRQSTKYKNTVLVAKSRNGSLGSRFCFYPAILLTCPSLMPHRCAFNPALDPVGIANPGQLAPRVEQDNDGGLVIEPGLHHQTLARFVDVAGLG